MKTNITMNKFITSIVLITWCSVFSQKESTKNDYDRWSVELNVGQNKALRPFTTGYYSSDPTIYFNINGIEHYDLGVRYMFSPIFGLKLDVAQDIIKNNENGSIEFENKQLRVGFQGVANLGRLMQFETFTNRIGLLAHAGVQVSKHMPQLGVNKGVSEDNGGVMFGLTPQFRITNYLVATADFTIINNVRQHLNWDGSYAATDNNLTGIMYNTSLGLTLYLGKNEKHADWHIPAKDVEKVDDVARKRLDSIETLMNDTDKDGVADYLDQENNTPAGIAVDSRGKFIDANRNGVPDELERNAKDGKDGSNTTIVSKEDALKSLVEKGYLNVFFDVNKDNPNKGSTNSIFQIIVFLRNYPETSVTLKGYADIRGNEAKNRDLSTKRAQRIFDIITSSGIDPSRVSIAGEGVDTSFNNSEIGLDLARRVSITIK